ncbi:MAG: hypothetical protein ABIN79_07435, partial [Marmoricola sp.]
GQGGAPNVAPSTEPGGGTASPDKTSQGPLEPASSESGPDRGPILLAGLVTFIAGAVIVSIGLRRRA